MHPETSATKDSIERQLLTLAEERERQAAIFRRAALTIAVLRLNAESGRGVLSRMIDEYESVILRRRERE